MNLILLLLLIPSVLWAAPGDTRDPVTIDSGGVVKNGVSITYSNNLFSVVTPATTNAVVRWQDLTGATNTVSTNSTAIFLGITSNAVSSSISTIAITSSNLVAGFGVTTNWSALVPGGGTNTLVITNGVIKSITNP